MKRLILLLLVCAMSVSLCSCSYFNNAKTTTSTVSVEYDYGRIQPGEITVLFNGCFLDFEYSRSDVTLIPGDTVTFKHTGYLISTMSYPGHTRLNDGVIKEITYSYATVSEVEADKITRDGEGRVISVVGAEDVKQVIINENYDFLPLEEYTADNLFASYNEQGIAALFAFNPRA